MTGGENRFSLIDITYVSSFRKIMLHSYVSLHRLTPFAPMLCSAGAFEEVYSWSVAGTEN